jgi:hypothetical protein
LGSTVTCFRTAIRPPAPPLKLIPSFDTASVDSGNGCGLHLIFFMIPDQIISITIE